MSTKKPPIRCPSEKKGKSWVKNYPIDRFLEELKLVKNGAKYSRKKKFDFLLRVLVFIEETMKNNMHITKALNKKITKLMNGVESLPQLGSNDFATADTGDRLCECRRKIMFLLPLL